MKNWALRWELLAKWLDSECDDIGLLCLHWNKGGKPVSNFVDGSVRSNTEHSRTLHHLSWTRAFWRTFKLVVALEGIKYKELCERCRLFTGPYRFVDISDQMKDNLINSSLKNREYLFNFPPFERQSETTTTSLTGRLLAWEDLVLPLNRKAHRIHVHRW